MIRKGDQTADWITVLQHKTKTLLCCEVKVAANLRRSSVDVTAAEDLADLQLQIVAALELSAASLGLPPTLGAKWKPVPADVRGRDGSEVTRRSEVYFWTQII